MKTINWNEAPKDATHHGKFENHECWYQIKGDEVFSWSMLMRSDTRFWSDTCWKPEQLTANNEGNVTFTPRPEVKPAYTFVSGQDVFIAQINTLAGVESQRYYIKESWCACVHQVEYADLDLLFHTKEEAESKCRELIGLPPLESRSEIKPVYTQEMHEAGELPPIGSKYLDEDGQVCEALLHYSHFVIGDMLEYLNSQQYPSFSTSRNDRIKPLEPPVKLVDGKAYQFDYNGKEYVGICNTTIKYKTVHVMFESPIKNTKINSEFCTNIQPLTVGK